MTTAAQMVADMARVARLLDGLSIEPRHLEWICGVVSSQLEGSDLDKAADAFGLGEPEWYAENRGVKRAGTWADLSMYVYTGAADYPRQAPELVEAVSS